MSKEIVFEFNFVLMNFPKGKKPFFSEVPGQDKREAIRGIY